MTKMMICPKRIECVNTGCDHRVPHELSDSPILSCKATKICPACIPYVPEAPSVLLTDEEQGNIMANCENPDCEFKVKTTCLPCPDMLKAQHLKSVKAVFDFLDGEACGINMKTGKKEPVALVMSHEDYEYFKKKMLEGK